MNSLIFNGVPFDSAQGTPFIDFLGFHCVLKRTVLGLVGYVAHLHLPTPKFAWYEGLTLIAGTNPLQICG
jgi:hypothetical protein